MLHYGLEWEVEGAGSRYLFDKHWHYDFQATTCPPWDLAGAHTDAKGGLFPHPPRARVFKRHVRPPPPFTSSHQPRSPSCPVCPRWSHSTGTAAPQLLLLVVKDRSALSRAGLVTYGMWKHTLSRCKRPLVRGLGHMLRLARRVRAPRCSPQGLKMLRDLLSIEVPLTLNGAFCEHHLKHCPPSEELLRECNRVCPLRSDQLHTEPQQRTATAPPRSSGTVTHEQPACPAWTTEDADSLPPGTLARAL